MEGVIIDQIGHEVRVDSTQPLQIVCLVPSITELLFDLGLDKEVVGITWFCIHPKDKLKGKAKIGGTKNPKLDKIAELKPTLILANKEENRKEDIEQLQKLYPTYTSDIQTIEESLAMIADVGKLTNKEAEAQSWISRIEQAWACVPPARKNVKVLYLIWREPYMGAGNGTYIGDVIRRIGMENVLDENARYPSLMMEKMVKLAPELVLLSSEPYPFTYKHIEELQAVLPQSQILLVDGEMFSWYGSRMLAAAGYIRAFFERD